jgi:DNA-binding CsgD family transcriptional regulator
MRMRVLKLAESGKSASQIAKKVNLSVWAVRRIVPKDRKKAAAPKD